MAASKTVERIIMWSKDPVYDYKTKIIETTISKKYVGIHSLK